MNLAIAATTLALVILAELPDKTFISCLVLSSRHRPLPVWVGACSALVLQAGIAVVAGGLIALLPKLAVRSVVAALFLGGALYLLVTTERVEQERAERLASAEERSLARERSSFWRVTAITFGVVAVAEFGDITQVLIANLSAHYRDRLAVFAGAARRVRARFGRRRACRAHDHALGATCDRPAPLGPCLARLWHLLSRFASPQVEAGRFEWSGHEMNPVSRPQSLLEAARATKGFMPDEEGLALAKLAERVVLAGFSSIVEVGAYCGRSTLYLASGIARALSLGAAPAVVFSVDHHRGSEENQAGFEHHDNTLVDAGTGRMDTLPFWRRAMEAAGAEDLAIAVVGDSPTVAARWNVAAGLVFIDGGHGDAPAWADYQGWAPRVADGGWLAIHDVFPDPADGGRPPFEIYRARSQLWRVRRGTLGTNREPARARGGDPAPVPRRGRSQQGATRRQTAERPG